jgi:hypothetical protein
MAADVTLAITAVDSPTFPTIRTVSTGSIGIEIVAGIFEVEAFQGPGGGGGGGTIRPSSGLVFPRGT